MGENTKGKSQKLERGKQVYKPRKKIFLSALIFCESLSFWEGEGNRRVIEFWC